LVAVKPARTCLLGAGTMALTSVVRGLIFAGVFFLAACAGVKAPPADFPQGEPEIAGDVLVVRDGTKLPLRRWGPETPAAIVLALHGMGDYSNAFAVPAVEWAARGIVTYAPDQRGFGRAPMRGLWPGAATLRRDFADAVEAVRRKYPSVPVFALGESMGAAVVLSALAEPNPPPLDGVIVVSPAVWSRADMFWLYRAALWLTAHVAPSMTFTGKGLEIWPSDNIEMLKAYARDPQVLKETRADAISGLVDLMDQASQAAPRLETPPPILYLYGAHDQIVPIPALEAAAAALAGKAKVHEFPDGYHMLMRDRHGDTVRRTVADWILRSGEAAARRITEKCKMKP
jgi:acylglycerol lipase